MYEQASVVSIQQDGKVTVSCQSVACESCHAGGFCGAKGKSFIARNESDTALSIGDTVELYLPPGKTVLASFVALLLPVLLFPVGYYLPSLFKIDLPELGRVLFGIGGIACGFLISRIFSSKRAKEFTPQITRVIASSGS